MDIKIVKNGVGTKKLWLLEVWKVLGLVYYVGHTGCTLGILGMANRGSLAWYAGNMRSDSGGASTVNLGGTKVKIVLISLTTEKC